MNLVSLGATGLQDWLFQRLTAVILTIYILFLTGYGVVHYPLDFFTWQSLFHNPWMRLASLISLFSVSLHAWLGLWMVVTDYIKPVGLRIAINSLLLLMILSYLIWGITILWRI